MNTQALIEQVVSLPVEDRALIVESLLCSLNQPESEIDKKWAKIALKRLSEIRSGKVKPVSGKQVFNKIWDRFEK